MLFTGWGIADTHAGPSNLRWGLDNWVYGIVGYSAFRGTVGGETVRFGQGLYRFKPDGSKLEFLRSTSNNSWGVGFSEDGLLFGSTANGYPSVYMPIPNRYYEAVRGWSAVMLETSRPRTRFIPSPSRCARSTITADSRPPPATRSTPLGLIRRNTGTRGFVTEPTGHLVATFARSKGSDVVDYYGWNLLASDDEWTAPITAEVGPDGHVWVIDWYNYIVQHNPTPRGFKTGRATPTKRRSATRPTAGSTASSIRTPRQCAPRARPANAAGLVAALRDDNQLWRMHAQRILVERKQIDVVPDLIKLAAAHRRPDRLERRRDPCPLDVARPGCDRRSSPAPPSHVAALKHPSAGVRRNAIQVLPRALVPPERSSPPVFCRTRTPRCGWRPCSAWPISPRPRIGRALVAALRGGMAGESGSPRRPRQQPPGTTRHS